MSEKLQRQVAYIEANEIEELAKKVPPFNQKTKLGGVSGKLRDLVKLYNRYTEEVEKLIEEMKSK